MALGTAVEWMTIVEAKILHLLIWVQLPLPDLEIVIQLQAIDMRILVHHLALLDVTQALQVIWGKIANNICRVVNTYLGTDNISAIAHIEESIGWRILYVRI